MKKTTTISLIFVLILLVSLQAVSQTKSSVTQTVTFAVIHSAKHTLNTLANFQESNSASNFSRMTISQNSLDKISVKVTVAENSSNIAVTKNVSDNHVDIRSILQENKSAAIDRASTMVTVTE